MTNLVLTSGEFFPAPTRTPMYADETALTKGELARPWVMWFQQMFGGTGGSISPITLPDGTKVEDGDNPSGCSGLTIVLHADDDKVSDKEMSFKFTRDVDNWSSIFAVEVALRPFTLWVGSTLRALDEVICNTAGTMTFRCTQVGTSASAEPTWNTTMGAETTDGTAKWRRIIPPAAHGPYARQRATWPSDVLATGSAVTMIYGAKTITLNMTTPPADNTYKGKILLTFMSDLVTAKWEYSTACLAGAKIVDSNNKIQTCTVGGTTGVSEPTWNTTTGGTTSDNGITWTNGGGADRGLDGNYIDSQIGNNITIYSNARFVRTTTMNWAIIEPWYSGNSWEQTFTIPADLFNCDLESTVWQLKPVPMWELKTVIADVYTRNVFGVSQ